MKTKTDNISGQDFCQQYIFLPARSEDVWVWIQAKHFNMKAIPDKRFSLKVIGIISWVEAFVFEECIR